MKKILITLSLVMGLALSTQAQHFSNKDGQGGGCLAEVQLPMKCTMELALGKTAC